MLCYTYAVCYPLRTNTRWVETYARDEKAWRAAFAEAFVSAGALGTALEGPSRGGSAGRTSSSARGTRSSSSGSGGMVQASYSQLVTGAVVVGAVGVALGYWFGARRRRRAFM